MGLVKTRRLMAMHKQERAKAGLKSRQLKVTPPPQSSIRCPRTLQSPVVTPAVKPFPHLYKCGNVSGGGSCGITGGKKGFLWDW